jgi:rhomboid protease GluP
MLTANLAHAGILHLLGNMLTFYHLGPYVESAFGPARFLTLLAATGITSSLAHYVGASSYLLSR